MSQGERPRYLSWWKLAAGLGLLATFVGIPIGKTLVWMASISGWAVVFEGIATSVVWTVLVTFGLRLCWDGIWSVFIEPRAGGETHD